MDPLSALGLAASVVQFVSFASDLISRSAEIYRSTDGLSRKASDLEVTYSKLQGFSVSLETASRKDIALQISGKSDEFVRTHTFAINDLSWTCKTDCDRLLETIGDLRGQSGAKGRLKSFWLAFKDRWKQEDITELEQRLHYAQTTLTVHLSALAGHWQKNFERQLGDMRRVNEDLSAKHSTKLDEIARRINELGTRTATSFKPVDIDDLQMQMSQLSMAKVDVIKQQSILRSLNFEFLPARSFSIPDAHRETFEWIFAETPGQQNGSGGFRFLEWLLRGDGFFWISGKPGSGKSTLMKYLTNNPKTLRALQAWSLPRPAIVAKHFFWAAGTPMQKSWQGLLQTLLYEIFRQNPDLIEPMCGERWLSEPDLLQQEQWKLCELRDTLYRVADQETLAVKFCFFIDGLDEFEGDHLDACDALRRLSTSPHIKICVSSRPWNVFEDSFGHTDRFKLYMHELTADDIQTYVTESLERHPRWHTLDVEHGQAAWLFDEITQRAAGVFLWVVLVVKQLRSGLTERDSFADMQKRLESVPLDLGMFFRQILDSVEPFYHEKMATTLRVALAARHPLEIRMYKFHDDEYENSFYFLDPMPTPVDQDQELQQELTTRDMMVRRLNGRCRGLLELHGSRVEFLHRTVMDFLRTPEMTEYLQHRAPEHADSNLTLVKAYTAYIKSTPFPDQVTRKLFADYIHGSSSIMSVFTEACIFAQNLRHNATAHKALDELSWWIPRIGNFKLWGNDLNPGSLFFWEPIVQGKMISYMLYAVPRLPCYFPAILAPAESVLVFALIMSFGTGMQPTDGMKLLESFLKASDHPHLTYLCPQTYQFPELTADIALNYVMHKIVPSSFTAAWNQLRPDKCTSATGWDLEWALRSGVFTLLFQNHANPNIALVGQTPAHATPAWINFALLSLCMPAACSYQDLYHQTMEQFIAAGADMYVLAQRPDVETSAATEVLALDLFDMQLGQIPDNTRALIDQGVVSKIRWRIWSLTRDRYSEAEAEWLSQQTPKQDASRSPSGYCSGEGDQVQENSSRSDVQMLGQRPEDEAVVAPKSTRYRPSDPYGFDSFW